MTWTEIVPAEAAPDAAPVTIKIAKVHQTPSLLAVLSRAEFTRLGEPTSCAAFLGEGDDAGKLMIRFGEGPLKIVPARLAGAVLAVPLWPGAPDAPQPGRVAACANDAPGEIVITLPSEWLAGHG